MISSDQKFKHIQLFTCQLSSDQNSAP